MKGNILLVSFPFDDLSSSKVRPAVCLTGSIGPHRHLVLAFITSQAPGNPVQSDIVIPETHPLFLKTGLRVTSTVRLHRLMTVSASIVRRDLGELPSDLVDEIDAKLRVLFSLT